MWLSLAEVPRGRFRGGLWTLPCGTFLFACWILVPRPGIEPRTCAVEAQSPNPWTAREVPVELHLCFISFSLSLSCQLTCSCCSPHPPSHTHTLLEGRDYVTASPLPP